MYMWATILYITVDFHVNGLPRVLTTDNGSEFKNKLNAEMMILLGIKQYNHTPNIHRFKLIIIFSSIYLFGPCVQSNGLDERFNQPF